LNDKQEFRINGKSDVNPFLSLKGFLDKAIKTDYLYNLEFYANLMNTIAIKKQLEWFRSFSIKSLKTNGDDDIKIIMETLCSIAYYSKFDLRNYLNETEGIKNDIIPYTAL